MTVRQIHPQLAYKPPLGPKGKQLIADIIAGNIPGEWVYDQKEDGSRYLDHIEQANCIFTGRRISDITGFLSEGDIVKMSHLNLILPSLAKSILDSEYMTTSAHSHVQAPLRVFDALAYKGKDLMNLVLRVRNEYKAQIVQEILALHPNAPISIIPQYPVAGAQAAFDIIVAAGGEGLVLKNLDAIYVPGGKRRNTWVKMKNEESYDVVITDVTASTSDKYGPSGLNTFRHLHGSQYDDSGDLVEVTHIPATGFKDAEHKEFAVSGVSSLIGKIAEVEGQCRSSLGVRIRHPRFKKWRDDKSKDQCRIDEGKEI
jgi:ATP-dependent DNA ligase